MVEEPDENVMWHTRSKKFDDSGYSRDFDFVNAPVMKFSTK